MKVKAVKGASQLLLRKKIDEHKDKKPIGRNDPYWVQKLPNGKRKKVRKTIPSFIPEHDAKILLACKERAYKWDVGNSFMGLRFGKSALIGLIPEIGDTVDVFMALYIYFSMKRCKAKLPKKFKATCKWNICQDFLVGLIPFIGDFADTLFRANVRNVQMFEDALVDYYGDQMGLTKKQKQWSVLEPFTEHMDGRYNGDHDKSESLGPLSDERPWWRFWDRTDHKPDVEKGLDHSQDHEAEEMQEYARPRPVEKPLPAAPTA